MAEVQDNPEQSQFEIYVDGERIGRMTYHRSGDVLIAPHTEINPAYGGNGYGQALVKGALDQIRAADLKVRPACPFVQYYLDNHPDYQDLVA